MRNISICSSQSIRRRRRLAQKRRIRKQSRQLLKSFQEQKKVNSNHNKSTSINLKNCTHDYNNSKLKLSNKRKRNKRSKSMIDPILLTSLGPNRFEFVRPNGKKVIFGLESLVEYFLKTGDFKDPESRIEFSDEDLKRIDEQVKKLNLPYSSVYEAKQNPKKNFKI